MAAKVNQIPQCIFQEYSQMIQWSPFQCFSERICWLLFFPLSGYSVKVCSKIMLWKCSYKLKSLNVQHIQWALKKNPNLVKHFKPIMTLFRLPLWSARSPCAFSACSPACAAVITIPLSFSCSILLSVQIEKVSGFVIGSPMSLLFTS